MYIKTVEVVALGHRRRTWFVYGLAVHQKDGTDAVTCSEPTSKQSNHYWYKIVGKTKEYAQMVLDLPCSLFYAPKATRFLDGRG